MNNPFGVLGVSPNATDDQIREAYRYQARQCQENIEKGIRVMENQSRMRELDTAYDEIIMTRSGNGSYSSAGNSGSYGYNSNPTSDYTDIRQKIRAGRLDDAQMLLDGVPEYNRNAEWYFLKGSVQQRKGWLEEASGNYAAACRMDPNNAEYRAAYNNMQSSRSGGYRTTRTQPTQSRKSGGGCSACDICTGLMCADCCCECMGGDLISCC